MSNHPGQLFSLAVAGLMLSLSTAAEADDGLKTPGATALSGAALPKAVVHAALRGAALRGVRESVAWCGRPGEDLWLRLTTNASGRIVRAGLAGHGEPSTRRHPSGTLTDTQKRACVARSLTGAMLGSKLAKRTLITHVRLAAPAPAASSARLRGVALKGVQESVAWCGSRTEKWAVELHTNASGRVLRAGLAGYRPADSLHRRGGALAALRKARLDACIAEALEGVTLGTTLANRTVVTKVSPQTVLHITPAPSMPTNSARSLRAGRGAAPNRAKRASRTRVARLSPR